MHWHLHYLTPSPQHRTKLHRQAMEPRSFLDLLKDFQEEELKQLLNLTILQKYNPGSAIVSHYLKAIRMLEERVGVPAHMEHQFELFERDKKWFAGIVSKRVCLSTPLPQEETYDGTHHAHKHVCYA